jgi:hypothetical protein
MPKVLLSQLGVAMRHLDPAGIRAAAARPVRILAVASTSEAYAALEDYLLPAGVSRARRLEAAAMLDRVMDVRDAAGYDLLFYEEGIPLPEEWAPGDNAFPFRPQEPGLAVRSVLRHKDEWMLPLAGRFPPFRQAATTKIVRTISQENALVAIISALPNVLPNLGELPWAVVEAAGDSAVLTLNQIRMAFLLAAASDKPTGYRDQRAEIGAIVAGAFGWRSLARELAGKIPFGGGLLPKAAIAYAGTYVAGRSLERLYRVGYGLTRAERRALYGDALERGREVGRKLLAQLRDKKS